MNRYLKTKDGTWLKPSLSVGLPAFPDDGTKWAADVARDLGLGELTVVDDEGDPRKGVLIEDPTMVPDPVQPPSKLDTLIDAIANAKDLAELKAATTAIKA